MIGDSERFRQVDELFQAALEQPPEDRRAFLAAATADRSVLAAVAHLLAADEEAGSFLERPLLAPVDRRRIGCYALRDRLGDGGMGTVYRAERADQAFEKTVALKVVHPDLRSPEVIERFHRERRILARLDHPNIARLLDGGTAEDGAPYLVMEYVRGEPIDRYCDARRLDLVARLRLFRRVLAAVGHAHDQQVVHRDLKPSNVLVTPEGEPKLLDFGIAKLLEPPDGLPSALTSAGSRPLTPRYASPEQLRGEAVGTASDVYSLGVVLYELLTGRPPSKPSAAPISEPTARRSPERPSDALRGSPDGPRAAHCRRSSIRGLARQLAGDLDKITLKALHAEPGRRYASARELDADLERHISGRPVRARPDTLAYRAGKFLRRHRLGLSLLAPVLVGLAVVATALIGQGRRVEREEERNARLLAYQTAILSRANPVVEPQGEGRTPTLAELLPTAVGLAEETFAEDPALLARALRMVGVIYRDRGAYSAAIELLERACRLESRPGWDGNRRAECLADLGEAFRMAHRYPEAARSHRQALRLIERHRGAGSDEAVEGRCNLGVALSMLGRHREALALLRPCEALAQRQLDRDPHQALVRLNQLASGLGRAGEWDAAEAVLSRALELSRRHLGPTHFQTGALMSLQARFYQRRGELEKAEAMDRELLAEVAGVNLSPDHPLLGMIEDRLGETLQLAGRHQEALEHLDRAVAIRRRALGAEDPQLADSLRRLAASLEAVGREEAAVAALEESLAIYQQAAGRRDDASAVRDRLARLRGP